MSVSAFSSRFSECVLFVCSAVHCVVAWTVITQLAPHPSFLSKLILCFKHKDLDDFAMENKYVRNMPSLLKREYIKLTGQRSSGGMGEERC